MNVASFPFATNYPVPGMVPYEDIQIQLIDMPPITVEKFEGLEELSQKLFEMLEIIRVYSKPPGKPVDMT